MLARRTAQFGLTPGQGRVACSAMADLTAPWIKIKGVLFLLMGTTSAFLLLADHLNLRDAFLLVITVWSFCRFYYFAFYVIEKYVDPEFRFAGLGSFFVYFIRSRRNR